MLNFNVIHYAEIFWSLIANVTLPQSHIHLQTHQQWIADSLTPQQPFSTFTSLEFLTKKIWKCPYKNSLLVPSSTSGPEVLLELHNIPCFKNGAAFFPAFLAIFSSEAHPSGFLFPQFRKHENSRIKPASYGCQTKAWMLILWHRLLKTLALRNVLRKRLWTSK